MSDSPAQSAATSTPTNDVSREFCGFESIDANFIYCPNQFFDVCLPHSSHGCVRLVGYIINQTLKWRDENGNPINEDIAVTFQQLISAAGISRGAITATINEAIDRGFIVCTKPAIPKRKGQPAQTAEYSLRWDSENEYLKDPAAFRGFFAGEGNRSPVPAAYFEQVIPSETLAVTKVVGAILRFTVGYQNQFGRRTQAPLSFSNIQQYTNLSNRTVVSEALKYALGANYIECVQAGAFSPDASVRRPASYSIKWLAVGQKQNVGSKSVPASVQKSHQGNSTKNVPGDPFKKRTKQGLKTRPGNRFKNETTRKTASKDTHKQQPVVVSLLKQQGFAERDAKQIAKDHSAKAIEQQIVWLPDREPSSNPIGMLRRAIQQNWSEPTSLITKAAKEAEAKALRSTPAESAQANVEGDKIMNERLEKKQERERLLAQWNHAANQQKVEAVKLVIHRSADPTIEERLKNCSLSNPPHSVLRALDELLHPVAAIS